MMSNTQIPRGLRNNNPLNIEYSTRNGWRGQCGSDGRFARFHSMAYGYRAALKLLRNYQRLHHCYTLRQMITRWCPPGEPGNDTETYIRTVSQRSGLPTDVPLDLNCKAVAVALLEAMTYVECGVTGDIDAIKTAYEMLRID